MIAISNVTIPKDKDINANCGDAIFQISINKEDLLTVLSINV